MREEEADETGCDHQAPSERRTRAPSCRDTCAPGGRKTPIANNYQQRGLAGVIGRLGEGEEAGGHQNCGFVVPEPGEPFFE